MSKAAEAAIREIVAEYERHQNNPEKFLALHTDDTAVVNIAGRRVLGKQALTAAMTAALDGPLAKVRTTVRIEDIRFALANVAIVSCTKTVHDERDITPDSANTTLPGTGSLTLVMINEAGQWRVSLAQTTPRAGA